MLHGQLNVKYFVEINFCISFGFINKANCQYRQCLYTVGRKMAAQTDEKGRCFWVAQDAVLHFEICTPRKWMDAKCLSASCSCMCWEKNNGRKKGSMQLNV